MGGGEIIASFLDEQAIDEFVISVIPVFIALQQDSSHQIRRPVHHDGERRYRLGLHNRAQ